MNQVVQARSDQVSMGLSFLCAGHCVVSPLAVISLPSAFGMSLEGEALHFFMLFLVIPLSVFALTMGCKNHGRIRFAVFGGIGLALMIAAVALGEQMLGHYGERVLTLTGAGIIALCHLYNYRLCRHSEGCECDAHSDQ